MDANGVRDALDSRFRGNDGLTGVGLGLNSHSAIAALARVPPILAVARDSYLISDK